NLYRGKGRANTVEVGSAFAFTVSENVDGDVFVAFAPSAVALYRDRPDGSPRNTWPAVVAGIQRHGDNLRVQLSGAVAIAADVTPAAAVHLGLEPGHNVWASVKATEIRSYPA